MRRQEKGNSLCLWNATRPLSNVVMRRRETQVSDVSLQRRNYHFSEDGQQQRGILDAVIEATQNIKFKVFLYYK